MHFTVARFVMWRRNEGEAAQNSPSAYVCGAAVE